MKLEHYFLVRKARLDYVLKKVKALNNKAQLLKIKNEYRQYRRFLKQRFSYEKQIFKMNQKLTKQTLIEKQIF
jgi:hypothetical protein